ncbi:hypothetical protein DFH09DRAFT_1437998, partial [Mycena vulgaris]
TGVHVAPTSALIVPCSPPPARRAPPRLTSAQYGALRRSLSSCLGPRPPLSARLHVSTGSVYKPMTACCSALSALHLRRRPRPPAPSLPRLPTSRRIPAHAPTPFAARSPCLSHDAPRALPGALPRAPRCSTILPLIAAAIPRPPTPTRFRRVSLRVPAPSARPQQRAPPPPRWLRAPLHAVFQQATQHARVLPPPPRPAPPRPAPSRPLIPTALPLSYTPCCDKEHCPATSRDIRNTAFVELSCSPIFPMSLV